MDGVWIVGAEARAAGCTPANGADATGREAPTEGVTVGELENAGPLRTELPARATGELPAELSAAVRCDFTIVFALAVVLFFEKSDARESTTLRFVGTAESGTPASFIEGPTGLRTALTPPAAADLVDADTALALVDFPAAALPLGALPLLGEPAVGAAGV